MTAPERLTLDPVTVETRCRACGGVFSTGGISYPGSPRPLAARGICDPCRAAQDAHHAKREREEREAAAEARRRGRLAELDPPALFADVTLEGLVLFGSSAQQLATQNAVAWARRYLAGWPTPAAPLAVFVGAPGCGKTMAAWAIARAVVHELEGRAVVTKCAKMVRDIRGAWKLRDADGEEDRRIARYVAPDLLVLDEVSRHAFYGEPTQTLYDVLDGRLEACRPTILTSNEDDAGLAALLGPALMDRLALGGVVDFGQESYRRWRGQGAA